MGRGVYDFDYRKFDQLPYFRLDPIDLDDVVILARRIRDVHAIAYDWNAEDVVGDDELQEHSEELMRVEAPDKIRRTIISMVGLLDARLEGD